MIESVMIWNEPNNLNHWDSFQDPNWEQFAALARLGAATTRQQCPDIPIVLGGICPIDAAFLKLLDTHGALEAFDVVGLHGFPMDWNPWALRDWPNQIASIRQVTAKPLWVTETGASSFGDEEVQDIGLRLTNELLTDSGLVERVYWYSLWDLPKSWPAMVRDQQLEGPSYERHYAMGLIGEHGMPKQALQHFDPRLGICQWIHFEDPRLPQMCTWLKHLGVKRLRTGISWADWHRPQSHLWFDRQMRALEEFEVLLTLAFTPPSIGKTPSCTSPPRDVEEFGRFVHEVLSRYC